jgi:putative membrane protein
MIYRSILLRSFSWAGPLTLCALAGTALPACNDGDGQARTTTTPSTSGTGTSTNMGPSTSGTSAGTGTPATSGGSTVGTGSPSTGSGTATAPNPADGSSMGSGTNAGGSATSPGALDLSTVPTLTDGQILYVVDTLNAGEVNQARAALPKLSNADVRDFAREMISAHTPARDAMLRIAETANVDPAASTLASALQSNSQAMVNGLLAVDEAGADQLYMDDQVSAHTEADQLIQALIDATDTPMLRDELVQMRSDVQEHLSAARALNEAPPQ